jgi:hypothetical protein
MFVCFILILKRDSTADNTIDLSFINTNYTLYYVREVGAF